MRPAYGAGTIAGCSSSHAVLAAASGRLDVAGLLLVEPALYDIARGDAVVERHIGIVTEARAQADAGNLRGFWAIFRTLMFGQAFNAGRWDTERAAAQRWATSNVPWGHGVRPHTISGIPTLVLKGATHRPQDLPGIARAALTFMLSLTS